MDHLGIAVIEGRWDDRLNISVRDLFDLLGNIFCENPNTYHYEMFNSHDSLKKISIRVSKDRQIKNFYIASHGNEDGINTEDDGIISRTQLRNIFRVIARTNRATLHGVFFGSCLFCNLESARYLFKRGQNREVKLKWIAGYREEVDWIKSSSIDMLFWHMYLLRKLNHPAETETHTIQAVGSSMMRFAPGAFNDLGFNIYVRGARGIVNPLIHG